MVCFNTKKKMILEKTKNQNTRFWGKDLKTKKYNDDEMLVGLETTRPWEELFYFNNATKPYTTPTYSFTLFLLKLLQ